MRSPEPRFVEIPTCYGGDLGPDLAFVAEHNGLTPDDVVDFTPELKAQALEVLKRYKNVGSPFAPGVVGDPNGILGAIIPGTATNWPGFGYDPDTHTAFMPTGNMTTPRVF